MSGPSHNGYLLPAPTSEEKLLVWLLGILEPMNRTRVKQLLRQGRVSVNGVVTSRHDSPLLPGDKVAIAREVPAAVDRSLEAAGISILYEDDALIVIDKPPGLLSVATESERTDTAFARLNAHMTSRGLGRPFVVHRLDRETSGLLLFARSAAVRDRVQENWGKAKKTYLAVVEGRPPRAEGVVDNFLTEGRNLRMGAARGGKGARRAVSRYRVVLVRGRCALVEVDLETGRKHQIRVHLAGLGCPVVGDSVYGSTTDPAGRMGLHAYRLTLEHPTTRQMVALESALPEALRRIVVCDRYLGTQRPLPFFKLVSKVRP